MIATNKLIYADIWLYMDILYYCTVIYPRGKLLYSNKPDFMYGMIAIDPLKYDDIWVNSEAPYFRPTATTPATTATTPATLGPCLIFARLVT